MAIICAGCGGPIVERILLSALDRFWHIACLNCSYCGLRLDELGQSVFVRDNMLLCRQDYLRLFGLSGTCTKCRLKIPPDELVMRCQENVYHVGCFSCFHCQAPLHPGDKVCTINGNLFCEHEFPQLFANTPKWLPALKVNSSLSISSPTYLATTRNMVSQDLPGKSMDMARSSPHYSSAPDGHSLSTMPYSLTRSDLITVMNSHPASPGTNLGNPNHLLSDHSPISSSGCCLMDTDLSFLPDSISMAPSLAPEKPVRASPVPGSVVDPPATGRRKQKKVDSRRCPPLRVC
ncbi:hypothetical protein P879_07703 [Paragonimus westermani]|uniref:LIM zinc-binding domain-containing protein n=1 Tax=Paragonimus westermani TaxID=34504 RepID=A0A8T0D1J7_9TREM|nr:hypothetical protein P879_07703 [Paragonimus westermani]